MAPRGDESPKEVKKKESQRKSKESQLKKTSLQPSHSIDSILRMSLHEKRRAVSSIVAGKGVVCNKGMEQYLSSKQR